MKKNNKLWKYYFQNDLINEIKSNEILYRDDCLLIEKSDWEKLIYNKINPNYKNINKTIYIKKEIPEFIENISSVVKILRKNMMIKLVNKDLIIDFYKINDLKYFNSFNFYYGNNKLIIECNENNLCNALLILNPIDSIINNNKYLNAIVFKTFNHLKDDLYYNLLSKEIDLNYDNLKK